MGGTASVKDGYLSIVPAAGTNNILAYSPTELGLDTRYASELHIVADGVSDEQKAFLESVVRYVEDKELILDLDELYE